PGRAGSATGGLQGPAPGTGVLAGGGFGAQGGPAGLPQAPGLVPRGRGLARDPRAAGGLGGEAGDQHPPGAISTQAALGAVYADGRRCPGWADQPGPLGGGKQDMATPAARDPVSGPPPPGPSPTKGEGSQPAPPSPLVGEGGGGVRGDRLTGQQRQAVFRRES